MLKFSDTQHKEILLYLKSIFIIYTIYNSYLNYFLFTITLFLGFVNKIFYNEILIFYLLFFILEIHHHTRSNHKTEVLRFKIANDYSELSYATLHLYVRGWDWIYVQQPDFIKEIKNEKKKEVIVSIHRAVRRATNFTHKVKMFEFRQSIPLGQGEWANIDVKPLFGDDFPNKTQEIQISGLKSWMKSLIVTTDAASQNPLVCISLR